MGTEPLRTDVYRGWLIKLLLPPLGPNNWSGKAYGWPLGFFAGASRKKVLYFREGFEAGRIFNLKLLKSYCYRGDFA